MAKVYKITEAQREEIVHLINGHSPLAAKNMLNQLEELKPEKKAEEIKS